MKKVLMLALLILLGFPLATLADGYQPDKTYEGLFVNDRLYRLDNRSSMWSPDRAYTHADSFKCFAARNELSTKGTWTGVVITDYNCAANDEAPQRATGNYLNYLQTVVPASDKTKATP